MLSRSFGAPSFDRFWLFWNPIWGYYLGRWVMQPTGQVLPASAAVWLTFFASGVVHDVACSIVKMQPILLFSSWFAVIGSFVVLTAKFRWSIPRASFEIRATANAGWLIASYYLAQLIRPDGF